MKHMKKILALALLAVSLFAVALPALAVRNIPVKDYCVLTSDYVYFRTGPGQNYSDIGKYRQGTVYRVVTSTSSSLGWYQIYVPGYGNAYVREDMVGMANATAAAKVRYGTVDFYKTDSWKPMFLAVQKDINAYFRNRNDTAYSWYPLDEDGIYGDDTEDAIVRFQQLNGLTQDGIFGTNSKTKLFDYIRQNWLH